MRIKEVKLYSVSTWKHFAVDIKDVHTGVPGISAYIPLCGLRGFRDAVTTVEFKLRMLWIMWVDSVSSQEHLKVNFLWLQKDDTEKRVRDLKHKD
jgi:hypothetical protein